MWPLVPHDPNTPSPPSNNYLCNFKQLWCFLSIAVIIKLLCGHWTDVCSQGRSQYEANRGTCVSYFERVIPVLFYSVVIIKTLNK